MRHTSSGVSIGSHRWTFYGDLGAVSRAKLQGGVVSQKTECIETPVKENPSKQFFLYAKWRRKTGISLSAICR